MSSLSDRLTRVKKMFAGLCSRLGLGLVKIPITLENFHCLPLGWDVIAWWQRHGTTNSKVRRIQTGWSNDSTHH